MADRSTSDRVASVAAATPFQLLYEFYRLSGYEHRRHEPGTGTVPLAEAFAALDASGYAGWVSAEYKPSRRTEETLAWMGARA